MHSEPRNAPTIQWRRVACELTAISVISVALAIVTKGAVAKYVFVTTLDGLDNVFLAALLIGLGLLDAMRRLPVASERPARRARLLLWLAYSSICFIFGAYALTGILLVELIFDLSRVIAAAVKGRKSN